MTNKEKQEIKQEIVFRDNMTRKLGKGFKLFGSFFALGLVLTIWGFTGYHDPFLNVGDDVRNIIKWIALIAAIVFGVLTVMYFMSFRNSKKYTLQLIDQLKKQ